MSFKDEVVISFEATKDTFAEDSQVVKINDKTRLLRFAVVYGYNASGKSNLLKAFDYLRQFWLRKSNDMNENTKIVPFKLDSHSPLEHTKFELVFYVDTTKYAYLLELDNQQVYAEKLSYYKSEQPTMLFDRRFDNGQSVIGFGSSLKISKIVKESITVNCLKNMSVFAARISVNANIPLIDNALDMLLNGTTINLYADLTFVAKRLLSDDDLFIKYVLNFLSEADFNISNLKTIKSNDVIPLEIGDFGTNYTVDLGNLFDNESIQKEAFLSSRKERAVCFHTVETERGKETFSLNLDNPFSIHNEESMGTINMFGIVAVLYNALKCNNFLAIDEIETSLHPKLLEKILYEFLKVKNSRSQLIVTTHNDGLLDLTDDLIRKDSVWFTEKQKNGSTELYKLTDFRGVNRLSSIREAYRNKRFGATMNN